FIFPNPITHTNPYSPLERTGPFKYLRLRQPYPFLTAIQILVIHLIP
ncbi:hypothetical protein BDFB_000266, partial [Asbolus verrucosus]